MYVYIYIQFILSIYDMQFFQVNCMFLTLINASFIKYATLCQNFELRRGIRKKFP